MNNKINSQNISQNNFQEDISNNSKNNSQDICIKERFQRLLLSELFHNTNKIIENYKKIIKHTKELSLDSTNQQLEKLVIGALYSDINSRTHYIKKMKEKLKVFNKKYTLKRTSNKKE